MAIAYVEITAACNFRCSFCPLVSMERPMLTMPAATVLDLIAQIGRDRLAETISFHVMGEPTLHKDLVRFCEAATKKGLRVSLVTNGSRLSPALSRALLDTELSKLSISLRSPNDAYYSEIFKASRRLDYESYLAQIRSLIEESHSRGPDHPSALVIRVFRKRFTDALRQKVRHQQALYDTDAIIERLKAWGEEICGMTGRDLRRRHPERYAAKSVIPITPRAGISAGRIMSWWQQEADLADTKYPAVVSYCAGYRDQFAVLADGRVTACCLDHEGRNALGNVRERSLKEILTGPEVSGFTRSFERYRPPTKTCARCMGGNTIPEWLERQAVTVGRRAAAQGLLALKSR